MESSRKAPDPEFVIRAKGGSVTCISDGGIWEGYQVIFVGSADGTIRIWDMESKRSIRSFNGCSETNVLQLTRLGSSRILSHDRDGNITIWNLSETDVVLEDKFSVYQYGFCPATIISHDDKMLIGYQANSDSQLEVMNLENKNIVCQIKPSEKLGMIMQARLFDDKQTKHLFALIGYEDGSVGLWDVANCELRQRLKTHTDAVMCMDIDSECTKALIGSADNKLVQVSICTTVSDECIKLLKTVEIKSHGVASIRVRSDGKIAAAGCWDGKIRIFGWKKLKPLALLQYHSETVNCIEFDMNNRLVCGSKDGKISIWNIYNDA